VFVFEPSCVARNVKRFGFVNIFCFLSSILGDSDDEYDRFILPGVGFVFTESRLMDELAAITYT